MATEGVYLNPGQNPLRRKSQTQIFNCSGHTLITICMCVNYSQTTDLFITNCGDKGHFFLCMVLLSVPRLHKLHCRVMYLLRTKSWLGQIYYHYLYYIYIYMCVSVCVGSYMCMGAYLRVYIFIDMWRKRFLYI